MASFPIAKKIQSPLLQGIVRDHDDHSEAATMRSTGGAVVEEGDPEDKVRSWFVEYKCDVCGELVYEYDIDTHDLVSQALAQNGIRAT
jgi:hypothetical protein